MMTLHAPSFSGWRTTRAKTKPQMTRSLQTDRQPRGYWPMVHMLRRVPIRLDGMTRRRSQLSRPFEVWDRTAQYWDIISDRSWDHSPALLLGGDFYTGAVLASTLTKLVLRYAQVAKDPKAVNGLRAEVLFPLVVRPQPGTNGYHSGYAYHDFHHPCRSIQVRDGADRRRFAGAYHELRFYVGGP